MSTVSPYLRSPFLVNGRAFNHLLCFPLVVRFPVIESHSPCRISTFFHNVLHVPLRLGASQGGQGHQKLQGYLIQNQELWRGGPTIQIPSRRKTKKIPKPKLIWAKPTESPHPKPSTDAFHPLTWTWEKCVSGGGPKQRLSVSFLQIDIPVQDRVLNVSERSQLSSSWHLCGVWGREQTTCCQSVGGWPKFRLGSKGDPSAGLTKTY